MAVTKELLDILVCPKCKGPIAPSSDASTLDCAACRLRYPVRDGIPVLLIDEAERAD